MGRAHAEELLAGDHEGAQVEAALVGLAAGRGYPGVVLGQQRLERADEVLVGELRQGQAAGAAPEALGVLLGAEGPDGAVGMPVGLDALEDLLGVVQHGGGGVQGQGAVGTHLAAVPAGVQGPAHMGHVVGEVLAETGVGEDLLADGVGRGGGVGKQFEALCGHGKGSPLRPGPHAPGR